MNHLLSLAVSFSLLLASSIALADEAPAADTPAPSSAPIASMTPTTLAPAPAPAASPTVVVAQEPVVWAREHQWYGWQALIPDGVGIALLATTFAPRAVNDNSAGVIFGSGLIVLGVSGRIVHLAHGRYGIAAASLGLRVGTAILGSLVGGLIGTAQSSPASQDDNVPPGLVGALIGFGVARASAPSSTTRRSRGSASLFASGRRRRPRAPRATRRDKACRSRSPRSSMPREPASAWSGPSEPRVRSERPRDAPAEGTEPGREHDSRRVARARILPRSPSARLEDDRGHA
jgi:hypothetical protein